MSNLDTVINFLKVEPDYDKNDMIEKIMRTFNTSKSNAQAYLYNAKRKLGVVEVKAAPKTPKKKEYLPGQVSGVGIPRTKVDRAEVQKEMERINSELDDFELKHEWHKNNILLIKKKNLELIREVGQRLAREKQEAAAREAEMNFSSYEETDSSLSREDLRNLGL